jgi:hypothetical protein
MHRSTAVTGMLFAMTANLAASFIGLDNRFCGGGWPALYRGSSCITIGADTGFDLRGNFDA